MLDLSSYRKLNVIFYHQIYINLIDVYVYIGKLSVLFITSLLHVHETSVCKDFLHNLPRC